MRKLISILGCVLIVVSLGFAESFGFGASGFGLKQLLVLIVGTSIVGYATLFWNGLQSRRATQVSSCSDDSSLVGVSHHVAIVVALFAVLPLIALTGQSVSYLVCRMSETLFTRILPWTGLFTVLSFCLLLRKRHPIYLTAVTLFLCVMILEQLGARYNASNKYVYHATGEYKEKHSQLGYSLIPGALVQESKECPKDEEKVFSNITYTVGESSLRRSTSATAARKHAMFFGGSFTFGMGVEDSETLPSRFVQQTRGLYNAFNFGVGGWGTGQMLHLLRDIDSYGVEEPHGLAIYSFIEDHLYRNVGEFKSQASYRQNWIYFDQDDNNALAEWKIEDRPSVYLASQLWARARRGSHSFDACNTLLNLRPNFFSRKEMIDVTAAIIEESSKAYRQKYSGEFYVLFWPRRCLEGRERTYLKERLSAHDVSCIEIEPMPDESEAQIHARDAHPSSAEYEYVARKLVELLHSP